MRAHEVVILRHVAAHGPISCADIAKDTGLDREVVYRFLYKARCYDTGKHWINNPKNGTDGPGAYQITAAGLTALQAINA